MGKDHTHCATSIEFEIGVNNTDDKIKLLIKCEYFLRVYLLCYKFGTALRRFLNIFKKWFNLELNPNCNFLYDFVVEDHDFTHCATVSVVVWK